MVRKKRGYTSLRSSVSLSSSGAGGRPAEEIKLDARHATGSLAGRTRRPIPMRCVLCNRPIEHYDPGMHELRIDEHRTVAVCDDCTRKFIHWHGEKLARLFPTRAMKKRYGRGDR